MDRARAKLTGRQRGVMLPHLLQKDHTMTKAVSIVVATKDAPFTAGTADAAFTFAVTGQNFSATEDDAATTHVFSAIPAGDYNVTVTKLGFTASASFTVPADAPADVTFAVPDTISVLVG